MQQKLYQSIINKSIITNRCGPVVDISRDKSVDIGFSVGDVMKSTVKFYNERYSASHVSSMYSDV